MSNGLKNMPPETNLANRLRFKNLVPPGYENFCKSNFKSLIVTWLLKWLTGTLFRNRYTLWAIGGLVLFPLVLISCSGCSQVQPATDDTSTSQPYFMQKLEKLPAVESVVNWDLPPGINDRRGRHIKLTTPHYEIYTTIDDPLLLQVVPPFMESAYRAYQELLLEPVKPAHKLRIYMFNSRSQWEDFTRKHTGTAAPFFLKIKSGAYYYNHACVTYHIARHSDLAILAHEGWHQFNKELFAFHLPAWLDEGLATGFESHIRRDGRFLFTPQYNFSRLNSLKEAIATGKIFTLQELLAMDPGEVIALASRRQPPKPPHHIAQTYYAQLYALVRFLREYNYAQRYLQLQKMITDARRGTWPISTDLTRQARQKEKNPTRLWNSRVGMEIFIRYFGADWKTLQEEYYTFCRGIVSQYSPRD